MLANQRAAALQRLLRPLEQAWAVAFLSITLGGYLSFIERTIGIASSVGSSPLARLALLPLYGMMCCVILTHPRGFLRMAWRGRLALALVGLACLSTLWSVEPELTLRRGIALLAPTALGLVIALRFTTTELLRLLAVALGMSAIISVIVGLVLPSEGISSIGYGRAWHGVYQNKNSFGRAMALAAPVFVLVALDGRRYRRVAWLGAAGTLGLVVLARSVGGLITAAALLTLIPLFRSLRLRFTTTVGVWTVSILLAAVVLTLVFANVERVFGLLGRDLTLTGRTYIWAAMLANIRERPWLGYGYEAFWQGWGSAASVISSAGWEMLSGHNGFLDLWLDLGLVGVLTFLLGFGVAVRAAVLGARRTHTAAGLGPLIFLNFMVLMNVSSSSLLGPHSGFWALYVAVLSSDVLAKAGERWSEAIPASSEPPSNESRGVPRSPGTRAGSEHVSPGVGLLYRPRASRD